MEYTTLKGPIKAGTIGLIAGLGGGLLSLGGGTLAIPLLVWLLGLNAFQARGTALVLALFSAGTAVVVYQQGGQIDWWTALWIALPSAVLTPWIASRTEHLRNSQLVRLFGLVLIAGAMALLVRDFYQSSALIPGYLATPYLLVIGVLEALIAGSVGVSGGPVITPMLVLGLGMPQHLAQGCSLAARIPAILGGLVENNHHRHVCWRYIPALAVGGLIGGWLGSRGALYLPEQRLRQLFSLLLMILGAYYLLHPQKSKCNGSDNNPDREPMSSDKKS